MNDFMDKKICKKCKVEKSVNKFHLDKSRRDGRFVYCNECVRKLSKEYYSKNRDRILKKVMQYNKENSGRKKEYFRGYYVKNKGRLKPRYQEYRSTHKIEHSDYLKEWTKKKRRTDINYKLKFNIRKRIWAAVRNNGKSKSAIELLGCTIEELKKYLEDRFKNGMTWKNYGRRGWHIDHIVPCSKFDLSKKEEQLKCFNYTNLQPLWAKDNLRKWATILGKLN